MIQSNFLRLPGANRKTAGAAGAAAAVRDIVAVAEGEEARRRTCYFIARPYTISTCDN